MAELVSECEEVKIANDADVVRVRQAARTMAVAAALSLVDQTKIVTAASELARNVLVHGHGGLATLQVVLGEGGRRGVRAAFEDAGPGIADVELAMRDGYTTGNGLGLGLSGSRRLVDIFDLRTEPGAGTRVEVVKWGR